MTRIITLLALATLTLGAARPGADTSAPVVVKVHDSSVVLGDRFTIRDIADVTGANKSLVAQVGAVEVGTSPLPGQSRLMYTGDIRIRLLYNHVDLERVQLLASPTIRVTRDAVEIPTAEVVQAGADTLTSERAKKYADGATIEPIQPPSRGFSVAGKRTYNAVISHGNLETGPVAVLVTVLVDGSPIRSVEIPFRIRRGVRAVLTAHPLPPHKVLTADDLTVGTVDLSEVTGSPITDPATLIGKRTARQLAQGAALTEGCVELTPVIEVGAHVTLEMIAGGIRLRTTGIARAAGAVGQTIHVSTDTHKEFMAVVVDATTVRVEDNP